jgi:hypothetical protein
MMENFDSFELFEGDDIMTSYESRKMKNRRSAEAFRRRHQAYVEDLESLVKEKNAMLDIQRKRNFELLKENEELKYIIYNLKQNKPNTN